MFVRYWFFVSFKGSKIIYYFKLILGALKFYYIVVNVKFVDFGFLLFRE